MISSLRNASKQILSITIAIELIAVFYCCAAILSISYDHFMTRQSRYLGSVVTSAYYQENMLPYIAAASIIIDEEAEKIKIEAEKHWNGPVLSRGRGVNYGPSGKETYYNLNMSGVVSIMRGMGNTDEYWVRDDGCKMLGKYIMVAANLNVHPRGSIVETSLGPGIVCDTGGFARRNPTQIDIATNW